MYTKARWIHLTQNQQSAAYGTKVPGLLSFYMQKDHPDVYRDGLVSRTTGVLSGGDR
jgi:hypothetical protein